MGYSLKELNERLLDITGKCDVLTLQLRQNRIPEYLESGNLFLGQFKIVNVMTFRKIFNERLMMMDSVFSDQKEMKNYINDTPTPYATHSGMHSSVNMISTNSKESKT